MEARQLKSVTPGTRKMEQLEKTVESLKADVQDLKIQLDKVHPLTGTNRFDLLLWTIEAMSLFFTIGFGFRVKEVCWQSTVACVLHFCFSVVTTAFLSWNKAIEPTPTNELLFCIKNFLCLTKSGLFSLPEPDSKRYRKLWKLETKLLESYVRLLVCFFTLVPACFVQCVFLFTSTWAFNNELVAISVSRTIFILTCVLTTARTVHHYEKVTLEYRDQLYKFEENVIHRKVYRATVLRNFITICLRLSGAALLYTASPYLALAYAIINFTANYFVLKFVPRLELPYVNAPQGVHSTSSFWTFRIINIISGVGTRYNVNIIPFVWSLYLEVSGWKHILYACQILDMSYPLLVLGVLTLVNFEYLNAEGSVFGYSLLVWLFFVIIEGVVCRASEHLLSGKKLVDALYGTHLASFENYPVITGYSFYSVLFKHVREIGSLESVRRLLVVSWVAGRSFDACYQELVEDRDETVRKLAHEFAEVLDFGTDELMGKIEECRESRVKEGFPFVREFEYMQKLIIESDEDDYMKGKNLKLLYLVFAHFNWNIGIMTSYSVGKSFELMGVEVSSDPEMLEREFKCKNDKFVSETEDSNELFSFEEFDLMKNSAIEKELDDEKIRVLSLLNWFVGRFSYHLKRDQIIAILEVLGADTSVMDGK